MISFEDFRKMMAFDLEGKYCIEIEFCVRNSEKFKDCGLGKMPEKSTRKDLYWFGLTPDGKNEYSYQSFAEMSHDKVFDGMSLLDVWESVEILSIDGCDPAERLECYIKRAN